MAGFLPQGGGGGSRILTIFDRISAGRSGRPSSFAAAAAAAAQIKSAPDR